MSVNRFYSKEEINKKYCFYVLEERNNRKCYLTSHYCPELIKYCYEQAQRKEEDEKEVNISFKTMVQEQYFHRFILNLKCDRKDYKKKYKKKIIIAAQQLIDPAIDISYVLFSSSNDKEKNIYFVFLGFVLFREGQNLEVLKRLLGILNNETYNKILTTTLNLPLPGFGLTLKEYDSDLTEDEAIYLVHGNNCDLKKGIVWY